MRMTIELTLKGKEDEPDLVAAETLEALADNLRAAAPHDFLTGGFEDYRASVAYKWSASA